VALVCDTGPLLAAPPDATDLARCRALQARYADFSLGVVDASVVALLERLGEHKVATLDQRHFRAVRPAHVEAFELLP
jgi:predicted nucleic acid-binding protein